jgi:hypothetical protein
VQETQPLIDFLFAGAGVAAGGGVAAVVVVVVELPAPGAPLVVDEPVVAAPVVAVAVGLAPAMATVTGDPTVLMLDPSAVTVVFAAPDLSTVPVTVPVTAPGAAVVPDETLSVELPCMDPQAARGRTTAIDTTEKEHAHLTRCLANAIAWNRVTE